MKIMADRKLLHFSGTCSYCQRRIDSLSKAVAWVADPTTEAQQEVGLLHREACQYAHARQAAALGSGPFVVVEMPVFARNLLALVAGNLAAKIEERRLEEAATREAARVRALNRRTEEQARRVRSRSQRKRRPAAAPSSPQPDPPKEAA